MIAIFLSKIKNLKPYAVTPIKKDTTVYSLPNIVYATSATRQLEYYQRNVWVISN